MMDLCALPDRSEELWRAFKDWREDCNKTGKEHAHGPLRTFTRTGTSTFEDPSWLLHSAPDPWLS